MGGALSYPDYVDYAAAVKSFSSAGAYASRTFTLTGIAEPERIEGARVSASMFPTLKAQCCLAVKPVRPLGLHRGRYPAWAPPLCRRPDPEGQ